MQVSRRALLTGAFVVRAERMGVAGVASVKLEYHDGYLYWPGAGSAIFLHIARPNFAPTEGCVAIERSALLNLIPLLGPASTLTIR